MMHAKYQNPEIMSLACVILPGVNRVIAICTKVWNCVNLSIFAFSEAGTCSVSIAITSLSIIIIFVVLESPNWYWYLLHNVVYTPGNLIIRCICERLSFETVQAQESFYGRNFHVQSHTSMLCFILQCLG